MLDLLELYQPPQKPESQCFHYVQHGELASLLGMPPISWCNYLGGGSWVSYFLHMPNICKHFYLHKLSTFAFGPDESFAITLSLSQWRFCHLSRSEALVSSIWLGLCWIIHINSGHHVLFIKDFFSLHGEVCIWLWKYALIIVLQHLESLSLNLRIIESYFSCSFYIYRIFGPK